MTIADTLARALQQHRAGNALQAERLYRQVLQADPRHADALNLLGVLASQRGAYDLAVSYLEQALAFKPSTAGFHNNLGFAYQSLGKWPEAEIHYHEALRLQPDFAMAYNNLGNVLREQAKLPDAVACYQQALHVQPDYAEAHNNLGVVFQDQGKFAEAEAHHLEALRIKPDFVDAFNNLGVALHRQGKLDQAVASLLQVLRLHPDHPGALSNLGNAFEAQGKLDKAVACYRQALRLQPEHAPTHNNLGLVLHEQGKWDEAMASFHEALRLRPVFPVTHNNLGNTLHQRGRLDEAAACFQEALRLNPAYAEAHGNLAGVLKDQGRMAQAGVHYQESLRLKPTTWLRIVHATMLPPIYQSMNELVDWRTRLTANLDSLEGQVSLDLARRPVVPPFQLAYQGMNDRDLQARIAALFARACPELSYVAPHCLPSAPLPPERPLRVGLISCSFATDAAGLHHVGLIRRLARPGMRLTVFHFADADDPQTPALHQATDEVVTLLPQRDLDAIRMQIAAQQLDVLVYTDLGRDRWTYFLAFARLAPVQCVAAGHPVTTGIPTIDYFLSARDLEGDNSQEHYTETLVRLANLPYYFDRPELTSPPRRRRDFGLPEDARLYVCPESLLKIHPGFDVLVAPILRADPKGVIVLIEGQHAHWTEMLQERLRQELADAAARVLFLPRPADDDFMHLLELADVVLDPPHFTGSTTSLQALAVGTPIITFPGQFLRGRQTYAYYRRLGLLDGVATDALDYARRALRLAMKPHRREEFRAKILAANHVLYGNAAVADELAQFFEEAVARARAARRPGS